MPEGEEEGQEIENLFEQIMKENFPNLAKEIDFQEVWEAQRVSKKLDPWKYTPRHITITLPKMKDKEKKFFYCCSSTVVSIFPPPLSPAPLTPISHPDSFSLWLCPWVPYTCSVLF